MFTLFTEVGCTTDLTEPPSGCVWGAAVVARLGDDDDTLIVLSEVHPN